MFTLKFKMSQSLIKFIKYYNKGIDEIKNKNYAQKIVFHRKAVQILNKLADERFAKKKLPEFGHKYFTNLLDKKDCLRLIESGEKNLINGKEITKQVFGNDHDKLSDYYLHSDIRAEESEEFFLLISKVMNSLNNELEVYFDGNYSFYWWTYNRTLPTSTPQVSFRWHKDGGHKSHLKIMIYLNDLKKIGGGTKFVSIEDSIFLSKQGLDSKKIDARLLDLKQFAGIKIFNYDISPGDVIVFQPSELFHLGEAPKALYRDHITLSIYPTDFSWRELDPKKFFSWQRHKKREQSLN